MGLKSGEIYTPEHDYMMEINIYTNLYVYMIGVPIS